MDAKLTLMGGRCMTWLVAAAALWGAAGCSDGSCDLVDSDSITAQPGLTQDGDPVVVASLLKTGECKDPPADLEHLRWDLDLAQVVVGLVTGVQLGKGVVSGGSFTWAEHGVTASVVRPSDLDLVVTFEAGGVSESVDCSSGGSALDCNVQ